MDQWYIPAVILTLLMVFSQHYITMSVIPRCETVNGVVAIQQTWSCHEVWPIEHPSSSQQLNVTRE